MTTHTALIVDDEPDIRSLLEITLTRMGITTHTAADLGSARNLLEKHQPHLCLTDMNLPDGNGIDLVHWIQQHAPNTPVAVITAYGSMDTAIESLKAGAFDFVSKPVELSYCQIWCMTIKRRLCQVDHPPVLHPETERCSRPASVG